MKIIIKVVDGLVQAVYADGDAEVEILDMDVNCFESISDEIEYDKEVKRMEETIKSDGWKQVY